VTGKRSKSTPPDRCATTRASSSSAGRDSLSVNIGIGYSSGRDAGTWTAVDERRVFSPVAVSVSQARRWARAQLAGHCSDSVAADVELCVSELAANAMQHTDSPFEVRLLAPDDAVVRVVVVDADVSVDPWARPATLPPDTHESGRGLAIVEELSARRGTTVEGTRKAVWCDVLI